MSSQHTVIVGGSSGIGLATARHLLESGARVTITGRSETRLAEAKRKLGPDAQAMAMDATAADALPAQFAKIGKFDHLVLALGSGKGLGPFASVSLADVKLSFEEKVYAHFATAQAALPFLIRREASPSSRPYPLTPQRRARQELGRPMRPWRRWSRSSPPNSSRSA